DDRPVPAADAAEGIAGALGLRHPRGLLVAGEPQAGPRLARLRLELALREVGEAVLEVVEQEGRRAVGRRLEQAPFDDALQTPDAAAPPSERFDRRDGRRLQRVE